MLKCVHKNAEVVEWYTRATQNRMPHGLWVQVPPSALKIFKMTFLEIIAIF